MAREDAHFRLRIPEALKRRIEGEASANNRSITAEILVRLERSFEDAEKIEELDENMADVYRRLERLEEQMFSITKHDLPLLRNL